MEDISVVLDLWNWYIKGVVIGEEEWKKIVLAKDLVKTSWMRKGRIVDINDLWKSILTVIDNFEKKLGEGVISSVILGISHPKMLIKRVVEQKRIITWTVEEDDIYHFDKIITRFDDEPNYEILKTIPVTWIIDEQVKVKDPLGMQAKKLEMVADIFMVPTSFYNWLIETFENIWIDIEDIIPNILWGAESVFDVELKDLWCCLIDIGTNQTSFVVYEELEPKVYWVIPYWWEDVTKDISIWFQVDIKEAEKLKREKWIILLDGQKIEDKDWVDINFLSEIISARYEDIFERIKKILQEYGLDGKLAWWIYLIWWWAKMKNLDGFAKEYFKLPVFYGKDKNVGVGDLGNNLQFVNVLWDLLWYEKYSERWWRWFKLSLSFDWFNNIISFFKKLF